MVCAMHLACFGLRSLASRLLLSKRWGALLFASALSASLLVSSHLAWAEDNTCALSLDCINTDQWSVALAAGYGEQSNPLINHAAIPIYLIPSIAYYGQSFFFDNGLFGYSLVENQDVAVNIIAAYSGERGYFYRWDPSNIFVSGASRQHHEDVIHEDGANSLNHNTPLAQRHFTYVAGIEAWYFNPLADISISVGHDLFGVHQGIEARVALTKLIAWSNFSLQLDASAHWQDADVIGYYYQPRAQEFGYHLPYEASTGISPQLGASLTYAIDEHWQLISLTRYRHLAASIVDSPLIIRDYSRHVFVGVAYLW
ncbi:MipA/OmpV family protein [Shewanella sp. SNU WT4]|nr:MipA/OmpV family protein [Shewanella sp. SNU WT4]